MQVLRVDRAHAAEARGIVIVIDVIRAFTVAGYALAGGARGLWLVRTVEEAFALRARDSKALLIGETGGRLIHGFDLNNSPSSMANAQVRGLQLIQRTGAGTQGAVGAYSATSLLLCAFTNALATVRYARSLARSTGVVTLLPTATHSEEMPRDEDKICADYVEALLQERSDAQSILTEGIAYLEAIDRFKFWKTGDPDFPFEDIAAVLAVNRFDFAILGSSKEWQGIRYVDAHQVRVEGLTTS